MKHTIKIFNTILKKIILIISISCRINANSCECLALCCPWCFENRLNEKNKNDSNKENKENSKEKMEIENFLKGYSSNKKYKKEKKNKKNLLSSQI